MKLTLVNKILEAKDTYSFYFESDISFDWQAGQYLVLKIDDQERQLTISSSPTEKTIQITTRIRQESEFKQKLTNLKIGEVVEARGPFGTFVLTEHYSLIPNHLFLAGGIGITPFRSMIKYNIDSNFKIPMFLVYSNSDPDFVYINELDNWQKENDFIKVHYHDSSVSGHLDVAKLSSLISNHYSLISCFWSVGPKEFVNSMEDILEELKVPQDQIKTEKFIGY